MVARFLGDDTLGPVGRWPSWCCRPRAAGGPPLAGTSTRQSRLCPNYSDRRAWPFQKIDSYRAPTWPDPEVPQQLHLDIKVNDIETAEARALELGAKRLPGGGTSFRVFADPVGHPFYLIWS